MPVQILILYVVIAVIEFGVVKYIDSLATQLDNSIFIHNLATDCIVTVVDVVVLTMTFFSHFDAH